MGLYSREEMRERKSNLPLSIQWSGSPVTFNYAKVQILRKAREM